MPTPAVLLLVTGWAVVPAGDGERTTPTGAALVTTIARPSDGLPPLEVDGVGVGAGTRDTENRPNVVRVVLGRAVDAAATSTEYVLSANVDDLDPRSWPAVLDALMAGGAADAWLAPILMKKGRPAHTLSVLAPPERAAALRTIMLEQTSTIGVRQARVDKHALARVTVEVDVQGTAIPVKVAHDGTTILQATPEYDRVAELARRVGRPVADVLSEAVAATRAASLVPGTPPPAG